MKTLLKKEFRLCASPITYCYLPLCLLFLAPGYPILCGAFFVCVGLFQSFLSTGENQDLLFSALLPVSKKDVVRAKYLFACCVELGAFVLMAAATLLRMTVLRNAALYRNNALMNANPFALGMVCLIFGLFNLIFLGGFFRSAGKTARPFISFAVSAFLLIGLSETLHHLPGLEALNAFGFEAFPLQAGLLAAGVAVCAGMTLLSCRASCGVFERTDL